MVRNLTRLTSLVAVGSLLFISSASAQTQFANKTITLKNVHSGRALCTLVNSKDPKSKENRQPIIQYDAYGDPTQKWQIEPVDGAYVIKNVHSQRVLSTLYNSADPKIKQAKVPIIQFHYYGDRTQKWNVQSENGKWKITNVHNGQALSTMHQSSDGKSKRNQERIVLSQATRGETTQLWDINLIQKAKVSSSFSNWMYANRTIIGNKKLNELAIPGAHDAGMYETKDTYLQKINLSDLGNSETAVFSPDANEAKRGLSFLGPAFVNWCKTQEKTVYQQLNGGVRYFDIRVAIDGNERLATCHGVYGASLNDMLRDVSRFLNENPNEIIILGFNKFWDRKFQQQHGKGPGEIEGLRDDKWKLLLDTVETSIGVRRLATPNNFAPTKTLNEIWNGNARVICNFNTKQPPNPRPWTLSGLEQYTWLADVWDFDSYKHGSLAKLQNASNSQLWASRCCATPDITYIATAQIGIASNYPIGIRDMAAQTTPQFLYWLLNDWKNQPVNLVWADFCNADLTKVCLARNGIPVDWRNSDIRNTNWRNWKTTDKAIAADLEKLGKELENAATKTGREVEAVANKIAGVFSGASGHVNPKHVRGNLLYDIQIKTGSQSGTFGEETAGTDSNVYVQLHGTNGASEWFLCDNEGDDFVANQTDRYRLTSKNLGSLTRIDVKKDGYGVGPDWYLQAVNVQIANQQYEWKSGSWVSSDKTQQLRLSRKAVEVLSPLTTKIVLQSEQSGFYLGNFHSGSSQYYPLMRRSRLNWLINLTKCRIRKTN